MELEKTPFFEEVDRILLGPEAPKFNIWSAEILANGKTIVPIQFNSLDIIRDYAGSYTDEIHLNVLLGAGTVEHDINPFKENLVVTLRRTPVNADGTETYTQKGDEYKFDPNVKGIDTYSQDVEVQSFRAFLVDDQSAKLEGNRPQDSDRDTGDLMSLRKLRLQLMDFAAEQLRMKTVGSLFLKQTPGQVLNHLLTSVSQEIEVDAPYRIIGVKEVEYSNKSPRDHIVVPHGTALTDMVDFLHYRGGGLYNAGAGAYLQYRHWYVYPLYDHTRFEKELKTLTLINLPKTRYPGVEKTFRRTAYQVIALVTGETKQLDDSESAQLNMGNGLRFAGAEEVLGGFVKVENNKAIATRENTNSEFKSRPRKTGLDNVHLSPKAITDNPFVELSRMARRNGAHLQVVWENSDPGLIIPAMPVKYSYLDKDEVKTVYGTVIGAHHFVQQSSPGFGNQRHVTNSVLTLFVNRLEE